VETLTDISDFVRQQEEILALRKTLDLNDHYFGILGKSAPMQQLFEMIESVAQSDAPVMITARAEPGRKWWHGPSTGPAHGSASRSSRSTAQR